MRFRSLVLTAIVAATAAFALPGIASADAPTRESVRLVRDIASFASCDGFHVNATFEIVREVTTFTDATDTPVRRQVHATINGVLTHSATGYSLPSTGIRNFQFDLIARTSFSTGTNTVVRLPSGGTIHLGTGRLQFDDTTGQLVSYSGPTDDSDYQALCDALSS
ncbi:hypothetical protein [Ornithinimicrobium cerasi]|uniref:Uncharacterized protein n=1 Tax=Ornithinimicrobium cerasi TaxID=2248773 RepID=A0A285VUJ5_9MICO|nr:hypothetical protein [Ornithinimicrobium cerasi]SOC57702.1 hypothetical protein SAMN05421879_11526 [Ornithinimicrobium cerasi]